MAPDRDQPPVTNYAPVSPLGWDACGSSYFFTTITSTIFSQNCSFHGFLPPLPVLRLIPSNEFVTIVRIKTITTVGETNRILFPIDT